MIGTERIRRVISEVRSSWRRMAAGLALALAATAAPAAVTQDWVSITQGTSGAMVALDPANNAYVAGSVPLSTILLTKYGPTGTQLWQRTFDNPVTREEATWVTLDAAGNAIVTGRLVQASTGTGIGLVVLKYDPAGTLLWQDVIELPFSAAVRALADAAGNVYVLGSGGNARDLITMKYSAAGVRLWTRTYSDTASSLDFAASMALTPAGNLIVTGGAQATMLAVAYDPAGNQVWAKSVTPATGAFDIAVSPQGEFYLVGGDLTPAANKGILVIKHDASFNELWRRTYAAGYYASRAALDSLGNLVATGVTPNAYFNWMTIKVSPAGTLLWSRLLDKRPSPDEVPNALAIGPDNAIYVTGEAGWLSTAGGNVTTYLGATTEKYAPDGTLVWSTQAQIPSRGVGIKLGTDGGVWVVGNGPQALLHYDQNGAGTPLPIAVAAADRTLGPEPLAVNFSSTGSTGAIVGYRWNFGDGSGSFEANPVHSFAAGSWLATLTVTDNVGATATSAPISITANAAPPPPPAPVAVVFANPTVSGGRSVRATVYLAFPVPAPTALTVTLVSSSPSIALPPQTVQVPVGANSVDFAIRIGALRATRTVTITATNAAGSASGVLTVVRN